MITSRPIVPTAHRSLPRASLRRSWGHSAPRTGPSHGPPGRSPPALTRRPFPAHLNPSVVFISSDHDHLESVITIVWNT
jgi:hypothetical protein